MESCRRRCREVSHVRIGILANCSLTNRHASRDAWFLSISIQPSAVDGSGCIGHSISLSPSPISSGRNVDLWQCLQSAIHRKAKSKYCTVEYSGCSQFPGLWAMDILCSATHVNDFFMPPPRRTSISPLFLTPDTPGMGSPGSESHLLARVVQRSQWRSRCHPAMLEPAGGPSVDAHCGVIRQETYRTKQSVSPF